jgi:hypothetical protein
MSIAMLVTGLILMLAAPEQVGEFDLHTAGVIIVCVAAVLLVIQIVMFIIAWLFR